MNRRSGSMTRRTLFRVGIDGDKLAGGLDEALELLSKESTKVDVYADTYSPNRSERDFDRLGEDPFMKWVGIGFCVMMICLGISMLVPSASRLAFAPSGLSSVGAVERAGFHSIRQLMGQAAETTHFAHRWRDPRPGVL